MKTYPENLWNFLEQDGVEHSEMALRNFFTYEYLSLTNSNSLNPGKSDKELKLYVSSLDNYLIFPMIFIRSIFHALNIQKLQFITLDQYVFGMMTIYKGELKERIQFIFNMFNFTKEQYVHKEDISLVLRYTHVFKDKKREDLLIKIINDFFGSNLIYSIDTFTNRIQKKNSGIFFLIMCIFYENKNYNDSLLCALDKEIKEDENQTMKKTYSKEALETCGIAPPNDDVIEYVNLNYMIDLSVLKNKNQKEEGSCKWYLW